MDYCGPRGIPLETFLDWPQLSQDAALTWAGYESRRCGECGVHPDEGPHHPHVNVCAHCAARDAAAKSEEGQLPGAHVTMAHGTSLDCPRCQLERRANEATKTGRSRGR